MSTSAISATHPHANRAYHADAALRDRVLAATAEHARLGQVVQGTYGDDLGRGCAVGCLCADVGVRRGDHAGLSVALGWPETMLRLMDRLHEGLTPAEARLWPGRVVAAVQVGADLDLVVPRYLLALIAERGPPGSCGTSS